MKILDAISRHPNPAAAVPTIGLPLAPMIDGSGSHPFAIVTSTESAPPGWIREAWHQKGMDKKAWENLPSDAERYAGVKTVLDCQPAPLIRRVIEILLGAGGQPPLINGADAVGLDLEQYNLGYTHGTSYGWYRQQSPVALNTKLRDVFVNAAAAVRSKSRPTYAYSFPSWRGLDDAAVEAMIGTSTAQQIAKAVTSFCVEFYVGNVRDMLFLARRASEVCRRLEFATGVQRKLGAMVGFDPADNCPSVDHLASPEMLSHQLLALKLAGFDEAYIWTGVRDNANTVAQADKAQRVGKWLEECRPVFDEIGD